MFTDAFKQCVSVIIPCYNCEDLIENAVVSCVMQGDSLKEIIVIDDQSTDDSRQRIAELENRFPGIVKHFTNPNKGGNNARNFGYEKSSGEYIQWLDADDVLLPGKFEAQLSKFNEEPNIDVVYSDWFMDFYDESNTHIKRDCRKKAAYMDFTYQILADNWSVPANYLFRRRLTDILAKIPAWNPMTNVAQDREYITLAALDGARFAYTPGFYSVYNRYNRDSVSKMQFHSRLDKQLELEHGFRLRIQQSLKYTKTQKKDYLAALNAHSINACFYAPELTIRCPFLLTNIDWKLIHYKKIPFVPFIYLWQHVKYFFKLRLSSH